MFTLNCRGKLVVIERPQVMGIINITPDSFYEGSRFMDTAGLLRRAENMLKDGADMLDIGGQSTRPGSDELSADEELRRLAGPVEALCRAFPEIIVSVDTWYADVAKEVIGAGASIINDISGGLLDPAILEVVGSAGVPYVCMHMKGRPSTMGGLAEYSDVTLEVMDYFVQRLAVCRAAGIKDVILDPGLGFAKHTGQNLRLLRDLPMFGIFGLPILLGVSRKGVIYRTLGITAEEALNGTTVLNTLGLQNGADILRVHDVKEARQAVDLMEVYKKSPI